MDCFNCGDCPFTTFDVPANLHEIHITVKAPDDISKFIKFCHSNEWKPIVLNLNSYLDVMITTNIKGNAFMAMTKANYIIDMAALQGFDVIRHKIETTMMNPIAVEAKGDNYYETHFAVKIYKVEDIEFLKHSATFRGCFHVSQNIYKEDVIMCTTRSTNCINLKHMNKVANIKSLLTSYGYVIDKVINEFCWHDTNIKHDDKWIGDVNAKTP